MSDTNTVGFSDGILNTIKTLIPIELTDTSFDKEIMFNINSALSQLNQLGVGPPDGFRITGDSETWTDLIGTTKKLDDVVNYVYIKTKLIFDTPQNSFIVQAYKDELKEIEFRLTVSVDEIKEDDQNV